MGNKYGYVAEFKKMGFGLFVHFGLYSVLGLGEWAKYHHDIPDEKYRLLAQKFKVKKTWAAELTKTAKAAGCKYITLTTRHHDGFSLYDTRGLNDYDAPHSAAGRDLIAEFVQECNNAGIIPFFYHTLLDWMHPDCKVEDEDKFSKYMDYLVDSMEILCTSYGKVGGFWLDGLWSMPYQSYKYQDRLYGVIRKYQSDAMIINNTGIKALGMVGHAEVDSVTFERGKPKVVDSLDRPLAGEMCQVLNDHWGYAARDVRYKSLSLLIGDLVDCRKYGSNLLLNTGLMANGSVKALEKGILLEIGKWIKFNKNFIYDIEPCGITAENASVVKGGDGYYYAIIDDVPMNGDLNLILGDISIKDVKIDAKVVSAVWLASGKEIAVKDNCFSVQPFPYGTSMDIRIAKMRLEI